MAKSDLQEQARAAGLDDSGTADELEARLRDAGVMVADREGAAGVASSDDNAKLEHSQGGVTTRDDSTDLGVPMLAGSPDERQGPEDALGDGPKRGDYSQVANDAVHYEMTPDGPVLQNANIDDRGDAEGLKGGVDTQTR